MTTSDIDNAPQGAAQDAPPAGAPAPEAAPSALADDAAPEAGQQPLSSGLPDWAPAVEGVPERQPWEPRAPTDETGDRPAARPTDYEVPSLMPLDADDDVAIAAMADARGLQNLLWSSGFPKHEGDAVLEAAISAAQRAPADMDNATFQLRVRETHGSLRSQLGEAEFDRCSAALERHVGELDGKSGGKLREYLDEHAHVLTDPLVLYRLLVHAGRLDHRKR